MSRVFVALTGGLGNQLFQYALGRFLSIKTGGELVIDDTFFVSPPAGLTPREYGLDQFQVSGRRITPSERRSLFTYSNRGMRFIRKFVNLPGLVDYYREPTDRLMLGVRQAKGNVLIDGFWQSELYFQGVEEVLRQELVPRPDVVGRFSDLAKQMHLGQTVSLHVRRGDYVADAKTIAHHGMCSLSYYREAVRYIKERIKNPHFFVFSDDQEWVSRNLEIGADFTPVIHQTPALPSVDLWLMANCKHHIIANSSFSWWGAWLNPNVEKLVVRPSVWMRAQPHMNSTTCPQTWIAIDE